MSLNQSPEIVRIANTLGIHRHPTPVDAIVEYCLKQVAEWIAELGVTVDSLSMLEKVVCAKLRLKFEYIISDEDLGRIRKTYTSKGEGVIKSIIDEMDDKTFGAVFERRNATLRDRDRYVAVIDCRGEKLARKFFTKWHEIAHLLTLKNQLELVLHRTRDVRPPEEQLMDIIAGRVGFYPSIIRRAFEAELEAYGRFSFGFVQRVRDNVCPDASFHSTLNACLQAHQRPTLLVRAALGLTKAEQEQVSGRQAKLFPEQMPIALLRAVSIQRNDAALAAKFGLHLNMRIPDDSFIYGAFHDRASGVFSDRPHFENMEIWRHSDGRGLSARPVAVYAKSHGDAVLALLVANSD